MFQFPHTTVTLPDRTIRKLFGYKIFWVVVFSISSWLPLVAAVPVISTPGAISKPENTHSITFAASNSPTSWAITGGVDRNKFTINTSGVLSFINPSDPDYENPSDQYEDHVYSVRLTATNASGTSSAKNFTITITNVDENPDPPSSLYVISQDHSNILNWTASAAGVITLYHVYRSQDSISSFTEIGTSATTTYTDNNLSNGKFYFYRVTAANGSGQSTPTKVDGSTPYPSPIAKYMHFGGNGDYLVVNDSLKVMAIPNTSSSMIEFWVRFASIPTNDVYFISRDYNTDPSLKFHSIYYDYLNNKIKYTNSADGIHPVIASSSDNNTFQINQWYHIAGVFSNATAPSNFLKLYINGHLQNANTPVSAGTDNTFETWGTSNPDDSRLVIGATTASISPYNYGSYFNGDMSEVRIWTTEFDSTTIQNNMYTRMRGDEANLLGLWHLDTLFSTVGKKQVYDYQKLNFNAEVNGNVSCGTPKVIAVDDTAGVLASSSSYINIRKNDKLNLPTGTPTSNVVTRVIHGPKPGNVTHGAVLVFNKDSIHYTPNCFLGKDTIWYTICDTTFFHNPYDYTDTAIVVVRSYDNVSPVITCPANKTIHCQDDNTPTVTGTATATDNCDPAPIITHSDVSTYDATASNLLHYNYTITRTWTATDVAGNTSSCIQTITVHDVTAPTFTVPAGVTISCDASQLPASTGTVTALADNCSPVANLTTSYSDVSTQDASVANIGHYNYTITRTWKVKDVAGNGDATTQDQTITVHDVTLPTITCTGNKTVSSDLNQSIYTHSGTTWDATGNDNCSIPTFAYTLSGATIGSGTSLDGVVLNLGLTTVTWTVTDGSGNTATCSYTVQVNDSQMPTIGCIANKTVSTDPNQCTYAHTGTAWDATGGDNAPGWVITYALIGATTGTGSSLNGVIFNKGITTVTWTNTDASSNVVSCSYTVNVNDTEIPTIACTANKIVSTDPNQCTYTQTGIGWDATGNDNCTGTSIAYALTGATTGAGTSLNNVIFNKGITTVTWTITDASSNTASCSYTVTVNDTQNPTISCAGNKIFYTDLNQCGYTNSGTGLDATGTDNCSGYNINYTLTGATTGSGTSLNTIGFNIGITTVTWTNTDASNNTASCSYTITVNDNQNPVITAPTDVSVNADAGVCTATGVALGTPVTTDNCGILSVSNDAPSSFPVGSTVVTWTVTDIHGNSNSATQTVTVTDAELPTITAPAQIIIAADPGQCYATGIVLGAPITGDNCGVNPATNDAPVQFNVGTNTVTWTVTDIHGNIATATQLVIINDNQNPSITAPLGVTAYTNAGFHYATGVVLGSSVTADNCGVFSVANDAPASFPAGITTVNWTVTDIHGNTNTATQTVTVIDNLPPTITSVTAVSIPENTTSVMTVTATDPDAGDVLQFSVTGGTDVTKFAIDAISGALSFITTPDYEIPTDANNDSIYEVIVTVKDNGGLTDSKTIEVRVLNANDPPTDILLSKTSVDEHQPSGTLVGMLTTMDEDVGDSHTYSLSGADAAFFSIVGSTLETTAVFDYLAKPAYSMTIRTTDSQGAYFDKAFTIGVNNINEPPVIFNTIGMPADTLNFVTFENESKQVCLNVTDPDKDITAISELYSKNGAGILSIETGTNCFNYTPANGFLGVEILYASVCDNAAPSMCDSVLITMNVVPNFIFSQVLSPNGDGINDTWIIAGLERFHDNKVTIFSRWGDVVYKVKGYDNVNVFWNGDYNNGKSSRGAVPDGTYFYMIELGNGSKLTGFIVLSR